MGPGLIAFFLATGCGTWIYNKFMHLTGNDTKRSVMAAIILGIVIFIIADYGFGLIAGSDS